MRTFLALIFVAGATCAAAAADGPYHLIKEIQIGGTGGWDYVSVDPQAHRLYVSHATKVVVVAIDTGKVVGEIAGTAGVHGFALFAPYLAIVFAALHLRSRRRARAALVPVYA